MPQPISVMRTHLPSAVTLTLSPGFEAFTALSIRLIMRLSRSAGAPCRTVSSSARSCTLTPRSSAFVRVESTANCSKSFRCTVSILGASCRNTESCTKASDNFSRRSLSLQMISVLLKVSSGSCSVLCRNWAKPLIAVKGVRISWPRLSIRVCLAWDSSLSSCICCCTVVSIWSRARASSPSSSWRSAAWIFCCLGAPSVIRSTSASSSLIGRFSRCRTKNNPTANNRTRLRTRIR